MINAHATRSLFRGLILLLVACSCSACTSLVQRPTATFRSAAVQDLNAEGVNVNFLVDLHNPNAIEVPLSAAQYKIGLAGVQVLDNQTTLTGSLPANGSLPLTLPVTLSFDSLLKAEQAIRDGKGELPYSFDGGLDFKSGQSLVPLPVHVPLQFNGTLSLRTVLSDPIALMKSPAARKLARETLGGLFSH